MSSSQRTKWSLHARRARTPVKRRRQPRIEMLEDRVVLSIWIGAYGYLDPQATGDLNAWSQPDNWLGGVPEAGGTAEFTDNVDFTLNGHNFTAPMARSPEPVSTPRGSCGPGGASRPVRRSQLRDDIKA